MHALSLGFPLISAIIGVSLGAFNETFAGPSCWIADYPEGCDGSPEKPCKGYLLGYLMAGGPVGVIFLCIITNLFRIYRHVKRCTLTRTRQQRRRQQPSVATLATQQEKRLQQVAMQAYLYVLVFCLTFVFGFVTQSMEAGADDNEWDETAIFPLIILHEVFYPLQGFWNFFIYCIPRYAAVRQEFPEASFWWICVQALKRDAQDVPVIRRRSSDGLDLPSRHQKATGALPGLRSGDSHPALPPQTVSPEPSKVSVPSNIHNDHHETDGRAKLPASEPVQDMNFSLDEKFDVSSHVIVSSSTIEKDGHRYDRRTKRKDDNAAAADCDNVGCQ
eukprot:scaffold200_cov173-Amphora_coffeaeformis.AAC.7